ncbi:MAG: hypothetical protein WC711_01460 [Candidatus Staskawiczbacteria bacterium]|jgi:orotate phosphoribosyltransferase
MKELTREGLKNLSMKWGLFLPTPENVLEWFGLLQAGWVYSGDPIKPHAKLHSGRHSNAFFLCKALLMHGNLREIIAACIVKRLLRAGLAHVDAVFGSPQSSILLTGDIGRLLGVPTLVLEKDPEDPKGKKMKFKHDVPLSEGAVLLQVEELITTFDSAIASRVAIDKATNNGVCYARQIGVFVYRPPVLNFRTNDGSLVVPFIAKQVDSWEPEDCPYCPQGSEALEPKGENWPKLLA